MAARLFYWSELRRVIAQWAGIALAAVLAGFLLGALMQIGYHRRPALEISVAAGFVMAIVFWGLMGRRYSVSVVQYAVVSPSTTFQFQGLLGIPVVATGALLVISAYTVNVPMNPLSLTGPTIACHSPNI